MAWFCKKCIQDGVMDEPWLEADKDGVVFSYVKEGQVISETCEGCGPGWFDRYGTPFQMDCECEDTDSVEVKE